MRSNFAVPDHDGTLAIGGAVGHPTTLTLDDLRAMPAHEHTVTLECAGNGRLEMRPLPTGEPWGDFAVSTARWTGALLHEVLARPRHRRKVSRSWPRGPTTGPTTFRPILPETDQDNLSFIRSLPLAHAMDPTSGILIAYEMNGEPLGRDHGAPFRLIVPHWYAVASVKWLTRLDVLTEPFTGEFQTGHYMYQWPDRPHEPVSLMRVRARITDPAPGAAIARGSYTVRGKAWSGTGPITRVDVSLTGEGDWQPAQLEPSRSGFHWQDWSFSWDTDRRRPTHPASPRDRRRRQRPARRPSVEPPRLRKQRHRSHLRRLPMTAQEHSPARSRCISCRDRRGVLALTEQDRELGERGLGRHVGARHGARAQQRRSGRVGTRLHRSPNALRDDDHDDALGCGGLDGCQELPVVATDRCPHHRPR